MVFLPRFLSLVAVLLALNVPLKAGDLLTYTSSGGLISGTWQSGGTFSNLSWVITGTADSLAVEHPPGSTTYSNLVINPTITLLDGTQVIQSGNLLTTSGTVSGDWYVMSSSFGSSSMAGFMWNTDYYDASLPPAGGTRSFPFLTWNGANTSLGTDLATTFSGTGTASTNTAWRMMLNTSFGAFAITGLTAQTGTFTVQAVPEPSSIALFGLGALAFLRRRRS